MPHSSPGDLAYCSARSFSEIGGTVMHNCGNRCIPQSAHSLSQESPDPIEIKKPFVPSWERRFVPAPVHLTAGRKVFPGCHLGLHGWSKRILRFRKMEGGGTT